MKKLILLLITCFAFNFGAKAQAISYTMFEWDIIRLGYAMPGGDDVSGGLSVSSEPRFNLKDNLSIGLRYEIAILSAVDGVGDNVDVGFSASYAFIGDYYFNTVSSKRAFAGFGIGSFIGASTTITDGNGTEDEIEGDSSFGVIPRVGFEFGHLRLSAEYNYAFKEEVSNYVGINLGITLWGGRK